VNRAGREEARRKQAAPSPEATATPRGCAYALSACLGLILVAFHFTGHWAWALAGMPATLVAVAWLRSILRERALLLEMRRAWEPRGIRCLVVYSDSPLWRDHVHTHWLPRLGSVAETLNWSERATWGPSLAVRLFDHFCGRNHNFNPAVVIFRVGARPLVFRFFYAFREAKHGDGQFVASLEQQMFAALQGSAPQLRVGAG
jgi:hypothetical protein